MSDPVKYMRNRATALREAADKALDPETYTKYRTGAMYVDLVADEIEAGFHE